MPHIGPSIDRRCNARFNSLHDDVEGVGPSALICFCCARILPYMPKVSETSRPIDYVPMLSSKRLFGLSEKAVAEIFAVDTYCEKYLYKDVTDDTVKDVRRGFLQDWTMIVDGVEVLCCPEDVRCRTCANPVENGPCNLCKVPMCCECMSEVKRKGMPQFALSNDMFFGYTPSIIYERQVTIIEMICASVCVANNTQIQLNVFDSLNEDVAHDPRQRTGARGNHIVWPILPEDIAATDAILESMRVQLPHWGKALLDFVHIVIYRMISETVSEEEKEEDADRIRTHIATAGRVRIEVVVLLIQMLVNCGNRWYQHIDMDAVKTRCQSLKDVDDLPFVDGTVPKYLCVTMDKSATDDVVDKSAAPADPVVDELNSEDYFVLSQSQCVMTNGVVPITDHNKADLEAMTRLRVYKQDEEPCSAHVSHPVDGDHMAEPVDQFTPSYWLKAFPFLFPLSTGAPDYQRGSHGGRRDVREGPEVEFRTRWCKVVASRAEMQFRSDQNFAFSIWNFAFRTTVNLRAQLKGVQRRVGDTVSNDEMDDAVKSIYENLHGTYVGASGTTMPVNGDLLKLQNCANVTPVAKHMLSGVNATLRQVEGSQQVRSIMHTGIQAFNVYYGLGCMITISPNEKYTHLMLRCHRTRRSDPCRKRHPETCNEDDACWGDMQQPRMLYDDGDEPEIPIDIEDVAQLLPDCPMRQKILVRDPLACVIGFRMLITALLKAVFGVTVCLNCPHCNDTADGCCDSFGSVAEPEGGAFGRADAYYGSIEQQNTGALHVHFSFWFQNMYQFCTLEEITSRIRESVQDAKERYDVEAQADIFMRGVGDESLNVCNAMQDNLFDDCLRWAGHVRDGRFGDVAAFVTKQGDFDRRGLRMFSNESHGWGRAFDNETHPFVLRRMQTEQEVQELILHYETRDVPSSQMTLNADAARWLAFQQRAYQVFILIFVVSDA